MLHCACTCWVGLCKQGARWWQPASIALATLIHVSSTWCFICTQCQLFVSMVSKSSFQRMSIAIMTNKLNKLCNIAQASLVAVCIHIYFSFNLSDQFTNHTTGSHPNNVSWTGRSSLNCGLRHWHRGSLQGKGWPRWRRLSTTMQMR